MGKKKTGKRKPAHRAGGCGCGCDCIECTRVDDLVTDDIVDGVHPECCGGAGVAAYRGYLQEVPGGGDLWRLYTNLGLAEYYLLCGRDILAQRKLGDGSVVWVCRDRPVKRVVAGTPDQEIADFMQGEISALWNSAAPDRRPGGDWGGSPANTIAPCPKSKPSTQCGC